MDTVLASEKRCDDKRCGRAACRCRAGCETTYEIDVYKRQGRKPDGNHSKRTDDGGLLAKQLLLRRLLDGGKYRG